MSAAVSAVLQGDTEARRTARKQELSRRTGREERKRR